jgi:hypothetical protein
MRTALHMRFQLHGIIGFSSPLVYATVFDVCPIKDTHHVFLCCALPSLECHVDEDAN